MNPCESLGCTRGNKRLRKQTSNVDKNHNKIIIIITTTTKIFIQVMKSVLWQHLNEHWNCLY